MIRFLLMMLLSIIASISLAQEDETPPENFILALSDGCTVTTITWLEQETREIPDVTGECDGIGVFQDDDDTGLIFFSYGTYLTGGYQDRIGNFLSEQFRIGYPVSLSPSAEQIAIMRPKFAINDPDNPLLDEYEIIVADVIDNEDYINEDGEDPPPAILSFDLILSRIPAQVWLSDEILLFNARQSIDDNEDQIFIYYMDTGESIWLAETRTPLSDYYSLPDNTLAIRAMTSGYIQLYEVLADDVLELAEEPYAWTSVMSPDGKWLAYIRTDEATEAHILSVLNTETDESTELATFDIDKRVTVPMWIHQ